MKKSFALFLLILAGMVVADCSRAAEVPLASKIVKVVVYPDAALLTRAGSTQVDPGTYQFVFADIIPMIDENSIRVSGKGSAKARIFGAQLKKEYLSEKPAERVRALENQIQALSDERSKLVDGHSVVMMEREWLGSLKFFAQGQLPKDLVSKVPATKDLGDLLKFIDVSFKDNYAAAFDLTSKVREVDKKIDALRRELSGIATPDKTKRSIAVDVEVLKSGSLDIMVSYLVYGVTWQSMYDARALFEKSEAELVSYGLVRQATGEPWSDVEVFLSTAKPSIGGRMPELVSWFLMPFQPRRARAQAYEPYYREAMNSLDGAVLESRSDIGGAKDKKFALKSVMMPSEVAYATSEQKGVSVTYKIPRKATIASDGSDVRLPVSSQNLAAEFKYSAFPKFSDLAYLAAWVKNSGDLQLPAGRVSVFLGDDFVGTSAIDNIAPSEKFDLFLGADENVKVKREQLEKKVDDVIVANIPSPNRKTTLKIKITVENYKPKKVRFELFEAMPVSQDERIKVKIEALSLEPTKKDYKDRPGVWRWEFELDPQAKKEITYTVVVEHPRTMQVEGL
jgi:uncharacterized protein (TIGR02231 family)